MSAERSSRSDLEIYHEACQKMGAAKLSDLKDEFSEFIAEPSLDELNDCLHSLMRVCRLPSTLTFFVANKTAMKHVNRMREYGCPRSKRNHLANNCNCNN